jgi:TrmH family RNA methyltransferase
MNPTALNNVVIVLDEPQDLVNIAGVLRAMKNMGISSLRLVRPAEFEAYRITGIAHRTEDLVERTRIFDTLEGAVADLIHLAGTTARARTAERNYARPRVAAPGIVERCQEGPVGIIFGREDRGLSNEALDLCHQVLMVPTAADYPSMNLAQALLIVVYELFLATDAAPRPLPVGRRSTRLAKVAEMEQMYEALRDGLERIEFFKARRPAGVMRTLRTLLARGEPTVREARLVRAIGFEIGHYLDRIGASSER